MWFWPIPPYRQARSFNVLRMHAGIISFTDYLLVVTLDRDTGILILCQSGFHNQTWKTNLTLKNGEIKKSEGLETHSILRRRTNIYFAVYKMWNDMYLNEQRWRKCILNIRKKTLEDKICRLLSPDMKCLQLKWHGFESILKSNTNKFLQFNLRRWLNISPYRYVHVFLRLTKRFQMAYVLSKEAHWVPVRQNKEWVFEGPIWVIAN